MATHEKSRTWHRWFTLGRIVPVLTIISAGTAISCSIIGVLETGVAENVTFALLGLLAIDALTERIGVLERIEIKLSEVSSGIFSQNLRGRDTIPKVEDYAGTALEIYILAVSALSLCHRYHHFFVKKLREGCRIRIILLDSTCSSIEVHKLQYGIDTAVKDIETSLEVLKSIKEKEGGNQFEVRFSPVLMPFSLFGVTNKKGKESVIVEYHNYKRTFGESPHLLLTSTESPDWFEFYKEQFEQAWTDSTLWDNRDSTSSDVKIQVKKDQIPVKKAI